MKVLKFGAIWCKECLVMKPMWSEIESELPNLVTEYYDADMDSEKLEKYKVETVPTFIFMDESENEIIRLKGAQNKEDLIRLAKEHIGK